MQTDAGLPLGTHCVLDYEPKELTDLQRDSLRVLARQVMAQLEMHKALRSSELLRMEVDHRVKNSLQSLASLARIEAMALLHEQLYNEGSTEDVDLGDYTHRVCRHLAGLAPPDVHLEAAADSVVVTTRQAVAVGTVLNELIANAFKHAYPENRSGTVRMETRLQSDGQITVACSDDGVGLPAEEERRSGGIGMKIVEVACMELGSDLNLSSTASGVTASVSFQPAED